VREHSNSLLRPRKLLLMHLVLMHLLLLLHLLLLHLLLHVMQRHMLLHLLRHLMPWHVMLRHEWRRPDRLAASPKAWSTGRKPACTIGWCPVEPFSTHQHSQCWSHLVPAFMAFGSRHKEAPACTVLVRANCMQSKHSIHGCSSLPDI